MARLLLLIIALAAIGAAQEPDQQDIECDELEIVDDCPVDCESLYCPKSEQTNGCPPRPEICPPPRCVCRFNTRRADNGTCIPTRECPPFECEKPFEEYNPCPPICPNGYCRQATSGGDCRLGRIGVILECNPGCRCIRGYRWNEDKVCVPINQCPRRSAQTDDE